MATSCVLLLVAVSCVDEPLPAPTPACVDSIDTHGPAEAQQSLSMEAASHGTWSIVAPEGPGQLYGSVYHAGRWFVLHGEAVGSTKVVTAETSWLSWSTDGVDWETRTLSDLPLASFWRLVSNGERLLVSGSRRLALFSPERGLEPLPTVGSRESSMVPIPGPGGFAVGGLDEVAWVSNDGELRVVGTWDLAQFHTGLYQGCEFLLSGTFKNLQSTDGQTWTELEQHGVCDDALDIEDFDALDIEDFDASEPPLVLCTRGFRAIAHGIGRYLAVHETGFYLSADARYWLPAPPPDGDDFVLEVDHAHGHFFLRDRDGGYRMSADGLAWSAPLSVTTPGPHDCGVDDCFVAVGRIFVAP